jgi:hypothetical protein
MENYTYKLTNDPRYAGIILLLLNGGDSDNDKDSIMPPTDVIATILPTK